MLCETGALPGTPAADGWWMPAEFESHAGCWMLWPERPDNWREGARPAQAAFRAVAEAIGRFEKVHIGVSAGQRATARALLPAHVGLLTLPHDDCWMRDVGPTYLVSEQPGLRAVHWRFNAWGGAEEGLYRPWDQDARVGAAVLAHEAVGRYRAPIVLEGGAIHVDGEGTALLTEQCVLNPNRNPGMTKAEVEAIFARLLGIKKTIWLPGDPDHVTGDMTDGHVDGVCAFARPGVLLVDATHDRGSVYAEVVRENRRALELATDARGRRFEMLELFEATDAVDTEAEVFCASYTNFYIANGAIIMPAYGIAADQVAAGVLAQAFPGREIVPVHINHLAHGGGGVHCITQQQPVQVMP